MTQQGVSKAVAELDRLGYTERVADPGDARIRRVRLHRTRPDRRGGGRRARTELDELLRRRSGTRRLAECHSLLAELLDELGGTVAVRHREVPMPH